jgi:hypothetical protein
MRPPWHGKCKVTRSNHRTAADKAASVQTTTFNLLWRWIMVAKAELPEYLEEIRQQVCTHCPERQPGGPPCAARGKTCGVELHLDRLVSCTREVQSDLIETYVAHNREEICAGCAFLHSDICPCPMEYLAVLVVQAIEEVDDRNGRWEWLRRRLSKTAGPRKVPVAEMCRAYEAATGTCVGCD